MLYTIYTLVYILFIDVFLFAYIKFFGTPLFLLNKNKESSEIARGTD